MHRNATRKAVRALLKGGSPPTSRPCDTQGIPPVPMGAAAGLVTPHPNIAHAFEHGYQSTMQHLVRGLGISSNTFGTQTLYLAATEGPRQVRPQDMATTVRRRVSGGDDDVAPRTVDGTKSFVRTTAQKVFVIARAAEASKTPPSATEDGILRVVQPDLRRPRSDPFVSSLFLAVVDLPVALANRTARFSTIHTLDFILEADPHGTLSMANTPCTLARCDTASLFVQGRDARRTDISCPKLYADGGAALLGMRDVEDAYVTVAVLGRVVQALLRCEEADAAACDVSKHPGVARVVDQCLSASLEISSVLDDAAADCSTKHMTEIPEATKHTLVGGASQTPVLFSPLNRVALHGALQSAAAAIHDAAARHLTEKDARDARKLTGLSASVRAKRLEVAKRDL